MEVVMRKPGVSLASAAAVGLLLAVSPPATEAPAAYDNETNGFVDQGQFDLARAGFDEREEIDEGLGPTYNAQSCGECHQSPVSGGGSQITELRAGQFDGRRFTDHVGGSLIQDRAIDASIQERVLGVDNVRAFRMSLPVLGDGFIEAIPDEAILAVAAHQPSGQRGLAIKVPVNEAGGALRVARFGWKGQHASLLSFAADAYLNEMGITSVLQPTENTSSGSPIDDFDEVDDPEDEATPEDPSGTDLGFFVRFMRASKAPPRDLVLAATTDARKGEVLFAQLGCSTCHVPDFVTAPVGTVFNGGTFVVTAPLANKRIHPYSDFLLHDVGTGDGIVQNGGPQTRNLLRTPPLWGLRTRDRLMHDGQSLTRTDAILRHGGQARSSFDAFQKLSFDDRQRLVVFLNSL
jgi:CxxC motif-containing protein (DUF1111 family)